MPRGSHSLIFLKIPLSSPLLKNVWKADTELEKSRRGGERKEEKKKEQRTSGSEGGVTALDCEGGGREEDRSSTLVACAQSSQVE